MDHVDRTSIERAGNTQQMEETQSRTWQVTAESGELTSASVSFERCVYFSF